jgi:hypothetical protein
MSTSFGAYVSLRITILMVDLLKQLILSKDLLNRNCDGGSKTADIEFDNLCT